MSTEPLFMSSEETVLERLRLAVSQYLGDERAAMLSDVELKVHREEALMAMAVSLVKEMTAQRLESDVQRVTFKRRVPVEDTLERHIYRPKTRWDAIKLYVLPGWMRRRLKKPAVLGPGVAWTTPRKRQVTIVVDEDVTIERFFTYPHSAYRLPPQQFGPAIYREQRLAPDWRKR